MLELVLRSAEQGIAVHDGRSVRFANERYVDLLGLPRKLMDGGGPLDEILALHAEAGTPMPADPAPDSGPARMECRKQDGTWLELSTSRADENLWVWTVTDITVRKRSEVELQEQTDILKDVFDNVAQGLAAYDDQARVITWNEKYQEFLVLDDDDIYPGCPVWDLVMLHAKRGTYGEGDLKYLEERVRQRIARLMGGDVVRFDYVNVHGIEMEAVSAPRPQGGFVVTYADISDRKLQEAEMIRTRDEAQAANRAKSSFLAAMSHEIRTPMNGIIGLIEVLRNSELDDDQRMLTATIHDSSMTLLTIIDDILDFSKIEAGRLELETVPVSLRRTAELALDTVSAGGRGQGTRPDPQHGGRCA